METIAVAKPTPFLPNPLDCRVGILIRTRRNELRMSQGQLAGAIGVTFQQVQKYEAGANRISFSRLVEVAKALRVNAAWFFEGLDEDALDPAGAREVTEFFRSAEGQAIAHAARVLTPGTRRALADFARSLAGQVEPA